MSRRSTSTLDDLRTDLTQALGFDEHATAEPYLNYISNCHIGRGTLEAYLKLFIAVIEHFTRGSVDKFVAPRSDSIQVLLNKLVLSGFGDHFTDTTAGSSIRKEGVEDTVMYILGAWTTMTSSFLQIHGNRKVTTAISKPYDQNLAGLIRGSGLIPAHGGWDYTKYNHGGEITRTATKLAMLLLNTINRQSPSNQSSLQDISS